jgi:hypothetical protein
MLKIKQISSILKIGFIISIVGIGVYAANPNLSSLTGAMMRSAIAAVSPSVKGGDWQPPKLPGQIGWTTSNPPVGNFATGAGLSNYVTCGGYWNSDTAVNVWAASTDNMSGLNHYNRNVYKAATAAGPFGLISSTTPSTNYETQTSLLTGAGVYEVEVSAQDNLGNQSEFTPRCRLTVDGDKPQSTASASLATSTNPHVTVNATATDAVSMVDKLSLSYRFKSNGGSFGAWTVVTTHDVADATSVTDSFDFDTASNGGDGVYEFYTTATDKAGNIEEAPASADANIEVDTATAQPSLTSPANGTVRNASGLVMDWSDVSDAHGPVKYDYQRSTDSSFATIDFTTAALTTSQIDQSSLGNGTYYWRVRACDALNNCSNYTSAWSVTVDNAAPISSVILSNAPSKDINNKVVNGDFENGLTGWNAVGDVNVINGIEHGVTPFDSKMVRIGRNSNIGANSVDVNILSQPVLNSGNGVRSVGFWYNFQTHENIPGFDEPGFMVFVGDKMVHQVWASDIPAPVPNVLHGTGWRFLSVDVSKFNNPTLTLAFYGGNSGDLLKQSFVYIDNVTTNEAAISSDSHFTLTASDNVAVSSLNYRYLVSGTPVTGSGPSGLTFSLTEQPDNGTVEYWAVDTAGNSEAHNNFHVSYDTSAPSTISDLSVNDDNNGDFTLHWTAPSDTNPYGVSQAGEYDIRYSTTAIDPSISDAAWAALPQPTIRTTDGLPGGSTRTPLLAGRSETYAVHVNNGAAQYWFAVKSKDRALNTSAISNVATTGAITPVTSATRPGDVVINEVMWSGSTVSSQDEWLELKNMTDKDVDLSGWSITNLGTNTQPVITLPAGTVVKASGYFVIANFAESNASSALLHAPDYVVNQIALANAGEQLTLKDNAAQTIDQTPVPAGNWTAGINGTNKRSMERNNIPGDGTSNSNWHSCNSQSCVEARSQYWKAVGNDFGTPGAANLSFDQATVPTKVTLTQVDADHFSAALDGVQNFNDMSYTLEYEHNVDGNVVKDAVTGHKTLADETRNTVIDAMYLGTCSTGAENCVSHAPVENVKLTVVLKGSNVPDRTITVTTSGQTVEDASSGSAEESSTAD